MAATPDPLMERMALQRATFERAGTAYSEAKAVAVSAFVRSQAYPALLQLRAELARRDPPAA